MRDAVSILQLGQGYVLGAQAVALKAAHVPLAPAGFPRQGSKDPRRATSWLLLGFCWQCCTRKCFLSLPKRLRGCQADALT